MFDFPLKFRFVFLCVCALSWHHSMCTMYAIHTNVCITFDNFFTMDGACQLFACRALYYINYLHSGNAAGMLWWHPCLFLCICLHKNWKILIRNGCNLIGIFYGPPYKCLDVGDNLTLTLTFDLESYCSILLRTISSQHCTPVWENCTGSDVLANIQLSDSVQ